VDCASGLWASRLLWTGPGPELELELGMPQGSPFQAWESGMNTHSGGNVMGQDAQNRTEEEPGMRLSGKSAALSSLCEALSSIPSTGKKER
jgi:hypothetical protein